MGGLLSTAGKEIDRFICVNFIQTEILRGTLEYFDVCGLPVQVLSRVFVQFCCLCMSLLGIRLLLPVLVYLSFL